MSNSQISYRNGDSYSGAVDSDQRPHGLGQYIWKNKSQFTGTFDQGCFKSGQFRDCANELVNGPMKFKMQQYAKFIGVVENGEKLVGSLTLQNGDTFEGSFVNKLLDGSGKVTRANGDVFEGQFANSKMTTGKLTKLKGFAPFQDGMVVVAEFKYGSVTGQGSATFADGSSYVGFWSSDLEFHGAGVFTFQSGIKFEGEFQHNCIGPGLYLTQRNERLNGRHKITHFTNGEEFDGEFVDGTQTSGQYKYLNGDVYVGAFSQQLPNQQGMLSLKNGDRITGTFSNGELYGERTYLCRCGISFTGEFTDNRIRKGLFSLEGKLISDQIDVQMYDKRYEGRVENGVFRYGKLYFGSDYFEGPVVDGVICGSGRLCSKQNIIEGEFIDGAVNGLAQVTYANGDFYIGGCITRKTNILKHGKGYLLGANCQLYMGEWKNDNQLMCLLLQDNILPPDTNQDITRIITKQIATQARK